MKTRKSLLLLLAIGLLAGCAGLHQSNRDQVQIHDFAEDLSGALDSVPENWTAVYYSDHQAIQQIRLKVSKNSDLVLNLLTNETKAWYPAKAQFALILTGEVVSGVVKPLAGMLQSPHASTVAGILPFLGTNGMLALTVGFQSQDAYVRRACASSLTWPIEFPAVDAEFQKRYRKIIRPYLGCWIQALHDPDVRVARAAAKSLGYATTDDSVIRTLEKLSNEVGVDAAVRSAALNSVDLMRSDKGPNRVMQD